MKENPLAPPKPPNQELLRHEQKRAVEAKVFAFKKNLKEQGLNDEEINTKVREFRIELAQKEQQIEAHRAITMHE